MTTRGIRNNNPFNIDRNNIVWQGAAADQSSDPRFVVFKTPEFGIRAGAKVLLTYQNHDGCKTIRQIIGRFAPPGENNTGAYIAALCAATGVGADDEINLDTVATMKPFAIGVITHENGQNPYPDSVISEGIRLAGVADAKPQPLHTQTAFVAHAGACVTAVGAACVEVVKTAIADPTSAAHSVKSVADSLGDYASLPMFGHVVHVMLYVAGGLTAAGLLSQFLKQKAA